MKFIKLTTYSIMGGEYYNMPCSVNMSNVNYFQQTGKTGELHTWTTLRFNDKSILSVRESEEEIHALLKSTT